MKHKVLASALVVVVGGAPAALVVLAAVLAPSRQTAGVLCFVALALAMIGTVYGPGWAEHCQHRRQVRARRRAGS
ncbi:hypothetical protein [Kitasatospora sp. NPDC001527]|uniref:hypothetical protein n=1 Tax=Kitasatospora sp. NPDC001527 TaxID=3154519 RepID=UPI00331A3090